MSSGWVDEVKRRVEIGAAIAQLDLTKGRMSTFGPCPACKADRRAKDDSRLPAVHGDGRWRCWRCSAHGDVLDLLSMVRFGEGTSGASQTRWTEIKAAAVALGWLTERQGSQPRLAPTARERQNPGRHIIGVQEAVAGRPKPKQEVEQDVGVGGGDFAWGLDLAECERMLATEAGQSAFAYLTTVRGFSQPTIEAWGLGCVERGGRLWVTIPLRDHRGDAINARFRSVPPRCAQSVDLPCGCGKCDECKAAKQFRVCPGRPLPLFGADRLPDDTAAPVIVTEGELDVVALYEYGYQRGVVSGTAGAKAFKDEWLDQLEPQASFLLAFDADTAGEEGAGLLADKLGRYRCSRVSLPHKDAGDCLAEGVSTERIEHAIIAGKSMLPTEIVGVGSFKHDLERLLRSPDALRGRPTGLARLDRVLGGLRPGLIVLTGETGQGKTTLGTWLLAEQARSGVPVLLTSLEQSPLGTVQKLLRAEMGGDFTARTPDERSEAIDALEALPIKILRHRGMLPWSELYDTIRYAVRRVGVRAILIDHLGFILDPEAEDERREIEKVLRALSIVAEHEGVSVILVCHPSNSAANNKRRVTLTDLKGASAIRQDAHEVWVVESAAPSQKRPFYGAWVHLDKIRSDFGSSGSSVLLAFDPLACTYADEWSQTPSGRRGARIVVPESQDVDGDDRPRRRPRPKKDGAVAAAGGDT